MELLKLMTKIHRFDSVEAFGSTFEFTENDVILTNQFLYDPFMKALNWPARVIFQEQFGSGEPTDVMMNAILAKANEKPFNRVIAIGGGTVLDIAKVLILKDIEDVTDAFERKKPLLKCAQLIAVPTTCGTGSEVTNITIAELTKKQTKMGLADDLLLPDHAVLIPSLLKGLPYPFYLYSSVDALIHAVESYVSPKANVYTKMFSVQAIETILDIYKELVQLGEAHRLERLEDMMIASNYAGIAFGSAGVGAVHALSYPLGGKYHVPHGEANYQMFTEVFKVYQQKDKGGAIAALTELLSKALSSENRKVPEEKVFEALETLLSSLIPKKPLSTYGMTAEEIDGFTESVIAGQQRLLANNCVPFDKEDIRGIYQRLY